MNSLLIGCGNCRVKRIPTLGKEWGNLTTLDIDIDSKPDIIHDLLVYPYPLESNSFAEIHAYEVLEHLWQQGDYKAFFRFFTEIHRLLTQGGVFAASVPQVDSMWAWGDPGHRSIVTAEQMVFLSQKQYREQVGVTTMTDYRQHWKGDFELIWQNSSNASLYFTIQKQ
jgi:predicted SAM-dependent methyltransferase